ncbi:MAG: type I methionyl aminopeptidase [Solobacterium sp.]|nr:type I methionyl aminopeptidase [Erysipelotrichaceae bacterium]MCI7732351.1 type I methionyl aminopeptidase [Solobacterium sp.]MDD5842070.1 type I methionyl aminopeptidase [Solobacterium sp.]MDD5983875.1 type I methionyl aminopeptidase [Solobacterium sp.]MDD6121882.1 type I methionyl aminopeptidase [Solobacterium sp.]
MISLKSSREIELMDRAGTVVALVHKRLKEEIKPGMTTKHIDQICEEVIRENGCTPSFKGLYGFPGSVCTSVNEVLVHGIPGSQILKNGDIISVDVGACYKGYHGDSAWTFLVGDVDEKTRDLCRVTEEALYRGLEQVRPGNRIGDISWAIQSYVEAHGYSCPIEYTGHGIGKSVHEDPYVPNVGRPHTGPILKRGMCIAIEPMVFMGKPHCHTLDDDWGVVANDHSLSAHYEHTIAITADGYKILTKED